MQQLFQRPEDHIPRIVILFRPRLNKKMDMIGHHASCEEFEPFSMKIPQRVERDAATLR